jgi:L-iditol 2-dehydrogenase
MIPSDNMMKVYIYSGTGELGIQERERPAMPEGGAVAKVRYTSICGTDMRTYVHGNEHILAPRILGHEALYELEEVSTEQADKFKPGERIIVAPAIGCGQCVSCRRGKTNMCNDLHTIGFEYDGTFAEYCAIPRQAFLMKNVIKVADAIQDIEACVAEPVACAINGQSFLNIQPGENVLVFGAGYLGCIHSELTLIKGAERVIVAEISPARRKQVKDAIPEVAVCDPSEGDLAERISDLTGGLGVDVVITACPVGKTQAQALEVVNKSGRISLFGGLAGESKGFLDSNRIHYKELSVYGVHASTPDQNRQALRLMEEGNLKVSKYLSIFRFDEIETAFQRLLSESVVKAVLKV